MKQSTIGSKRSGSLRIPINCLWVSSTPALKLTTGPEMRIVYLSKLTLIRRIWDFAITALLNPQENVFLRHRAKLRSSRKIAQSQLEVSSSNAEPEMWDIFLSEWKKRCWKRIVECISQATINAQVQIIMRRSFPDILEAFGDVVQLDGKVPDTFPTAMYLLFFSDLAGSSHTFPLYLSFFFYPFTTENRCNVQPFTPTRDCLRASRWNERFALGQKRVKSERTTTNESTIATFQEFRSYSPKTYSVMYRKYHVRSLA